MKNLESIPLHLFYSLRKYNIELAKALATVENLFGKISKSYTAIAELYCAGEVHDLYDVFKRLSGSFNSTIEPFKKLKESINNDIQKYFKYYNKELILLSSQFKELNNKAKQYLTMDKNLIKKKESLFAEGKVENWSLSKDCKYSAEVLLQNKELAFTEMLIGEKTRLVTLHRFCGYLLHKSDEEYRRISTKNEKDFREHFINLSKLYNTIFEQVIL